MTDSRAPLGRPFSERAGWLVTVAVAMVLVIAPLDVLFQHFQVSMMYVVPLTLMACCGRLRALRWLTLAALVLTLATYFIKYTVWVPETGPQYFSFRLFNRALVMAMLWLLSRVLSLWLETDNDRQDPLWSDDFDRAQSQISAMLGMLIAMPVVVVVALVDALTPGNFNLAVLYMVPLVTCAWVRSERLLWSMFALTQFLSFGGLYWGPPPNNAVFFYVLRNRFFVAAVTAIVTGLLHYRIHVKTLAAASSTVIEASAAEEPANGDEPAWSNKAGRTDD
jgi:hypothetical protein